MPGGKTTQGHPAVWAALTILTFPTVLLSAQAFDIPGLWPFFYAIIATCAVLALEALVRGKLWPFEPGFVEHVSHPATPMRLTVFVAACLFILETAFLLVIASNKQYDTGILAWMAQRHCLSRGDRSYQSFCAYLTNPVLPQRSEQKQNDIYGFEVRSQAAKLWFPDEHLVTCAERKINQTSLSPTSGNLASLVRCTAWGLDKNGYLRAKTSTMRFVGAQLTQNADGLYRVTAWSDDYASPGWTAALGSIAASSKQTAQSLAVLPDLVTVLDAEILGRAQEMLRK